VFTAIGSGIESAPTLAQKCQASERGMRILCDYLTIIGFLTKQSEGTLPEIEAAIKQLPENDIRQLASWLEDYLEQMWDKQIETDLASGKLDNLIAKAEADITANRVQDIDKILNH
jgi:hypothetical protein